MDNSEDSEAHVQGIEDYTIGEYSDEEGSESNGSDDESATEGSYSYSERAGTMTSQRIRASLRALTIV